MCALLGALSPAMSRGRCDLTGRPGGVISRVGALQYEAAPIGFGSVFGLNIALTCTRGPRSPVTFWPGSAVGVTEKRCISVRDTPRCLRCRFHGRARIPSRHRTVLRRRR
ncbi:MAG: hypothetical protein EOP75_00235 [Variovorax sp.]|nr:MAG: hypothetical protein EOP75_00235 [Variovorax sp.]